MFSISNLIKKAPTKVFCIGANKTGTTSLGVFLSQLGYNVAPQAPAELLIESWAERDFSQIIRFCKLHDAFQDIPFSLPYTFQALDQAYPESKFILTIRSSAEEWLKSYVRFTQKRLNIEHFPEMKDLQSDTYRYTGFTARVTQLTYGEETQLFDEQVYKHFYARHIENVTDYFRLRKKDLLVVNLSCPSTENKIKYFLHATHHPTAVLPHLNASG